MPTEQELGTPFNYDPLPGIGYPSVLLKESSLSLDGFPPFSPARLRSSTGKLFRKWRDGNVLDGIESKELSAFPKNRFAQIAYRF